MLFNFILRKILYIIGIFKGRKYKYSREIEGNFRYMGLEEKLWWAYKALIRQIEKAQEGMGIEAYFSNQNLEFNLAKNMDITDKLVLTAGGDLSCSEVIYPQSIQNLWKDVQSFYFSGDIVCANLEAPINKAKPLSGVPRVCLAAPELNLTEEMFDIFTEGGEKINFLSTANNHSLDQGEEGLTSTLEFLHKKGIAHTGTAKTEEEQMNIPIVEKNGIRTAFISYTFSLNGFDAIKGKEYMTNLVRLNKPDCDLELIKAHIKIAHSKGADVIVAMLHWSIEFETYPLKNIMEVGHKIMELGVDIILGGHPHVAQPMEKYCYLDPYTGLNKEGFIIYSMGELVSYNAFSKNSRLAMLVKVELAKGMEEEKEVTRILGIKLMPIYTWVSKKRGHWNYQLLDFIKLMEGLRSSKNIWGFTKVEIKELERLETLLYDRVLPRKYETIL